MRISGKQDIPLGVSIKEFFHLSLERIAEVLGLESDEVIHGASFGKHMVNLIIALDANFYVTNKRLIMIKGKDAYNIWYEHITYLELRKSTLLETLYMFSSFDSIIVTYNEKAGPQTVRLFCGNGVIGAPIAPSNDTTRAFYKVMEENK